MAPIKGHCRICNVGAAKYKCPICTITYCSVICYRTHKETPCSKPEPVPVEPSPPAFQDSGQPLRPFEQEEDEASSWRLRRHQLEALAATEALRMQLREHGLQGIVQRIDSAVDAEKELDKAMESPLFRSLAEQILSTVNPEREGVVVNDL